MPTDARILYCHCAYAQVVPAEVKDEVLRRLAESGVAFDAVADLCELSATRSPALPQLVDGVGAGGQTLRLAACYPRALRWMFSAAGVAWPEAGVEVANMRTEPADQVVQLLLHGRPAGAPPPADDEPAASPPAAQSSPSSSSSPPSSSPSKVEEPSAA
ncbi:MAG TPA: hypothetical protein VF796_20960 [Humisphaera sp.]